MELYTKAPKAENTQELADIAQRPALDIRMVQALAGDRALNAREEDIVNRVKEERGESIYSDMLYALTHKTFPTKQAHQLWAEIGNHRTFLKDVLGREPGLALATHDYLSNVTGMMKGVSIIEETKMESLANVATRDGLTGLIDQSTFKLRLKEEMERQTRYGGPLSLVMFDLDYFKKINDTFGHAEGDNVLRRIAEILRKQGRRMDTPARYGGEEFAVILPEVDLNAALIFAERLRQAIESHFENEEYNVTISAGIATRQPDVEQTPENLTKKADACLYAAKNSGRNKVCTSS